MALKRIILATVSLGLGVAAYMLFSSSDRRAPVEEAAEPSTAIDHFVTRASSQPAHSESPDGIPFPKGSYSKSQVFDEVTGRLKYEFEAREWRWLNEHDCEIQGLAIRLFRPDGQIIDIRCDEADVTADVRSDSRIDPKKGNLRGNVQVTIDRTTTEWREDHPDLAAAEKHPEAMIRIGLGEAAFDRAESELRSNGPVLVESEEAKIENVRGVTIQWNQVNNRLDVLRLHHGGKATIYRGGGMVDFALPGIGSAEREEKTAAGSETSVANEGTTGQEAAAKPGAVAAAPATGPGPRAEAMRPMSVEGVSASEAAEDIRLRATETVVNEPIAVSGAAVRFDEPSTGEGDGALRSETELAEAAAAMEADARAGQAGEVRHVETIVYGEEPPEKDSDSYRAEFDGSVVVEQRSGGKSLARMTADKLEINLDFPKSMGRSMASAGLNEEKQEEEKTTHTATANQPSTSLDTATTDPKPEREPVELVVTWDGPLDLRPLVVPKEERTNRRFDAIATGKPVTVWSDQGEATCHQLVYRKEQEQVWLAGGADRPVVLSVDQTRKVTASEVLFDQRRGLARLKGAGSMTETPQAVVAEEPDAIEPRRSAAVAEGFLPDGKNKGPMDIAWSKGVDLEMGKRWVDRVNPQTGQMEQKTRDYLRRAWFHGAVSIRRGSEEVVADELAVTFDFPSGGSRSLGPFEHFDAVGEVRLASGADEITADRIAASFVLTPDGKNVPRLAEATGNVYTRQGTMEARAGKMNVTMGPAGDGSRLGIREFEGIGDVLVTDPSQNLKISRAARLKAEMRDGEQLAKAIIESPDESVLARARVRDFAVHGRRIEVDNDSQSIDVPGGGKAWMVTRNDFGGRSLPEPTVVKIEWTDEMKMRLGENYGQFVGNVQSTSRSDGRVGSEIEFFDLSCQKLMVRFANEPPTKAKQGENVVERVWRLGDVVKDHATARPTSDQTVLMGEAKRPIHVTAEGGAVAQSRTHAPGSPDGQPGRLLSRMQLAGRQIVADLRREQVSVPCEGNLVIEDYQIDERGKPRALSRELPKGPLMSSLASDGPSQTVVTWENAMDFFLDRSLVVFDRRVQMVHCSGRQMARLEDLAASMKVDLETLPLGEGRRASLSCGNLLIEFLSSDGPRAKIGAGSMGMRATDLRRLIAKDAVLLEEGTKSLMGEQLQYLHDTDEVVLEGGDTVEARIFDQDESSQRFNMYHGPKLVWNRRTNEVQADRATIRSSRR